MRRTKTEKVRAIADRMHYFSSQIRIAQADRRRRGLFVFEHTVSLEALDKWADEIKAALEGNDDE